MSADRFIGGPMVVCDLTFIERITPKINDIEARSTFGLIINIIDQSYMKMLNYCFVVKKITLKQCDELQVETRKLS